MKKFSKKIEDFVCENCGAKIKGTGYTNHCPGCLYSKHVDVNPGDRACKCEGMMEPVGVEMRAGEYAITQRCKKCSFIRKNKASEEDMPAIIEFCRDMHKPR